MKQTRLNLGSFNRHHVDDNRPKTHFSDNAEQESPSTSKWNNNNNVLPTLSSDHQEEEDNFNRKQSVITKVKEKAKKWRQTLVRKKEASNDNTNHTPPSWGVALEDYEKDTEEAPTMYRSEIAPNRMQEDEPSSSRIPALGDDIKNSKNIRTSTNVHKREGVRQEVEENDKTYNPSPLEGISDFEEQKESKESNHTKSLAEAVIEKLGPGYNGAIYELSAKDRSYSGVQGMTLSRPLTVTPNTSEDETNVVDDDVAYGVYEDSGLGKGVSVADYIKNKLEPGEDERVLCQVISKAIGPRLGHGDKGVLEKVKEVVTSLMQAEQEQEDEIEIEIEEEEEEEIQQEQEQVDTPSTTWNTSSSSPQIPISTNAFEGEEESEERILQAN